VLAPGLDRWEGRIGCVHAGVDIACPQIDPVDFGDDITHVGSFMVFLIDCVPGGYDLFQDCAWNGVAFAFAALRSGVVEHVMHVCMKFFYVRMVV